MAPASPKPLIKELLDEQVRQWSRVYRGMYGTDDIIRATWPSHDRRFRGHGANMAGLVFNEEGRAYLISLLKTHPEITGDGETWALRRHFPDPSPESDEVIGSR